MIAKIGRGSNITGALSYNWLKVLAGNGKVLSTQKIIETPAGTYSMLQLYRSFKPYLIANKKTEKPVLHISLNPDPADKVSDESFKQIAEEYMQRMGYGNQPFVVFKHTDTTRTHIHIVSTCVDRNGKKLPDAYERLRSMDACRDLEQKYNLTPATEKQRSDNEQLFHPVNYRTGDIKSQIASVVRYLPKYYQYQTIGAYNALLSLFNIAAEEVKGEFHGQPKNGLVYFALDERGEKASNPFKASRFGKHAGLNDLKKHFTQAKEQMKNSPTRTTLKNIIETVKCVTTNEADFKKQLTEQGINSIVRRTDDGRVYGMTFIDHASRTVWNGSTLSNNLAANAFNDWWKNQAFEERIDHRYIDRSLSAPVETASEDYEKAHELFDFLYPEAPANVADISGLIDSFGGLLPEAQGEDYEEQIFTNRMKKKRRRQRDQR